MFRSKPHPDVRNRRRSPEVHLELLEDRLQPGSVMYGLGFSLVGSGLLGVDAGLSAPQDPSALMVHHLPDNVQDPSLDSQIALLTAVSAGDTTAVTAQASPTAAPAQQESRPSPALPLPSNVPAVSVSTVGANNVPASGQHSASGAAVVPMAAQAAPVLGPPSTASAAASHPTVTQFQATPQSGAPAATAVPIRSASLHSLSASVTTHVGPGGQNDIHPLASLNWTTYVSGTTGNAVARAATVDSAGNIYVTGYTDDGVVRQAFVAEYDNTGKQLAFTGFDASDPFTSYFQSEGHAIAVDNAGGVYVVGKATDAAAGDTDAFIMKFNSNNQLMPVPGYGGGVGGPFDDSGEGVAVNANGEATMTGTFKPSATETDMFAVKYTASGADTTINSYFLFAGADGSAGNAITLDSAGANAYLAGSIHHRGGDNDILVMEIDDTTASKVYAFTMTNPGDDTLNGINVDQTGQAYVVGTLAVSGGTSTNAFVAQVSADGKQLVNQYLIPNTQSGTAISLDPATGNAYVVANAPDAANNLHVLVQKFDKNLNPGDSLTISGNMAETGYGVAYDPNANVVYVAGSTTSKNLATDSTVLNGMSDAFLSNVGSFS